LSRSQNKSASDYVEYRRRDGTKTGK
jgi:dihydroflavonol-4-reductase